MMGDKKTIDILKDQLVCMLAVTQLEYRNKNLLSGTNESRCRQRIEFFENAIKLVEEIKGSEE